MIVRDDYLIKIIQKAIKNNTKIEDDIDVNEPLYNYSIDSLDMMLILTDIGKEIEIVLHEEDFDTKLTIQEMVEVLKEKLQKKVDFLSMLVKKEYRKSGNILLTREGRIN